MIFRAADIKTLPYVMRTAEAGYDMPYDITFFFSKNLAFLKEDMPLI